MNKKVSILGSTGSIGQSTLEVAAHLEDSISVVALAARSNIDLLEIQAKRFKPDLVAVYDKDQAIKLQKRLPTIPVIGGMEGLVAVATYKQAHFVVSAIVGAKGILPTLRAIEAGKTIGLANKEVLIAAGELIMSCARKKGVDIIPIDSEHSAVFQCLNGEKSESIKKIILTASGGPFLSRSVEDLEKITPACALKHPNWNMGQKVTIDSSTLMNKGLEVIEAHMLFGVALDQIEVVIHPQSLVHSFVEFIDGSLLAQLAKPDMKLPIQYALTYPERKEGLLPCFDFMKHSKLEFYPPNMEKFPCLGLAFEAARQGGTMPCFMNAANEVLVSHFLEGKIGWMEIGKRLEKLMASHEAEINQDLETLLAVDAAARELAQII